MKLWVLFAVHFDRDWAHGLDEVIGACLDEEEAREAARRLSIGYYRDNPKDFDRVHSYELEQRGHPIHLDEDELWDVVQQAGTERVEVREVDLDVVLDVGGLTPPQRKDALRGLAALLRPFRPAAARALEEQEEEGP